MESNESLMQAVAAGRLDRLTCLFDRCHSAVHALCARLVGSVDAADDLSQEVFLRVLRFRHSYRATASFRTWLYRIAYNACMDYRRSQRAAREVPIDALPEQGTVDEPSDHLRVAAVQRALCALPAPDRTVLVLSRFDGMTYAEIAAIMGSTPGAIRVRAHRALRALRSQLEHYDLS